jgi:hypothetical protein
LEKLVFLFVRTIFLDNIGYNLYDESVSYPGGGAFLDNKFYAKFYEKPDGTKPARDFLVGLPTKMRAKSLGQ